LVHIGALAGSLSGRVSDASGVKSLQSADVEIVELQRRAQTGNDCLFRFGDVPDGAYTLRTQYVGAPAVETKVNVSGDTRDEDRYVEDFIQYDLSARFRLTPQFQLFAEVVNLGDQPYVAYRNVGGRKRLLQYEEYSWTSKAGFRYTF
jgi:hypothetical protein